jgi:hypothetical protein
MEQQRKDWSAYNGGHDADRDFGRAYIASQSVRGHQENGAQQG